MGSNKVGAWIYQTLDTRQQKTDYWTEATASILTEEPSAGEPVGPTDTASQTTFTWEQPCDLGVNLYLPLPPSRRYPHTFCATSPSSPLLLPPSSTDKDPGLTQIIQDNLPSPAHDQHL